jgi:Flp pilus assembly protein TadB
VSNLEKRGNYMPRRAREQRAYRLVLTFGVSATVGVVSGVLWIVGLISGVIPLIALIVAVISAVLFRSMTRSR